MQEKKKILFVVHRLNYGGVQKALLSALDAIDYTKNEITLYIRKNQISLLSEVNKNVSKVIINQDKTHYYRKPYVIYLLLCKFIAKVLTCKKWIDFIQQRLIAYINESQMLYEKTHYFNDNEEYDVAIAYIQGYSAQFVAEYITAKKKVMFYHVSTDENHLLHEKVMPYFDQIVGVNENISKMLSNVYSAYANKMTFIDNFVDAMQIRERGKEYIFWDEEKEIVLCSCGRLSVEKGFDLAVKAAQVLKEKEIPFVWYFVGDGPEREKLEQLIRDVGLVKYVKITGMLDNPYPYIVKCDIYVQPSYEESFGLTIAEAKILCKPIVSTRTLGGESQIVHMKNGILTGFSGEEIAKGILKYINNKELKKGVVESLEIIEYSKIYKQYQLKWENLLKDESV